MKIFTGNYPLTPTSPYYLIERKYIPIVLQSLCLQIICACMIIIISCNNYEVEIVFWGNLILFYDPSLPCMHSKCNFSSFCFPNPTKILVSRILHFLEVTAFSKVQFYP